MRPRRRAHAEWVVWENGEQHANSDPLNVPFTPEIYIMFDSS